MAVSRVVRSTCGLCLAGCGVLIHLEENKPVKLEGDPDCPVSQGLLCPKGLASLEYLEQPDRLKHPLKRVGERGQGKWQRISWDEALDTIAGEITMAKQKYGAESVALMRGSHKGLQDTWAHRFGNALGTPNVGGPSNLCHFPRVLASVITYGFMLACDLEYPPSCIMVWGANSAETAHLAHRAVLEAVDKGAKLIVVDPRSIELTGRATMWLRVRPGSDLALALGMINVIINEVLYDKTFVQRWTVGFDELKKHAQDYSPDKVEDITWVEAQEIREAARLFATNKPACIQWGNALDQGVNSFQGNRAVTILQAITGNLGVPGGEAQWSAPQILSCNSPELHLRDKMSAVELGKTVNGDLKLLPLYRDALLQSVVKSVLEEEPYPIRVLYIQGFNALCVCGDAQKTYKALKKVDFLAVADHFMTPTAGLADIVLPIASYLECDSIDEVSSSMVKVQQKVSQVGECRSDYDVMSGLAGKLGLQQYFWDDEERCLDAILEPSGLTFDEFRKVGTLHGVKHYRRYEQKGFETPSGKVELYSNRLKEWGFDPLPVYYEPPETPYGDPELAEQYPLMFTTWKSRFFRHSGGRQISSLRGKYPDPVTQIHPETAGKLDIKEGDWIYVENRRGRIKQKASLTTGIDPRIVVVDYGWWFPEKGESNLYDWAESNVNILADSEPPFNREIGSTNMRGVLCRVYKA
jgi:anaerobic selenocysteine-containing dehydrogenase